MGNRILKFGISIVFVILCAPLWGQTTYVWSTTGSADFNLATNWTPNRNIVQSSDILQFSSGGTTTCTNVPSQSVSRIIVSNNTNVSFQSALADRVITISGSAGNNLDIQAGSTLQLSSTGANGIQIAFLSSPQNVSIAGTLQINANTARNNTFDATNTNTVVTGAVHNFGIITSTSANLTFKTGATYRHNFTTTKGAIPYSTWEDGSTCLIAGYTSPSDGFRQPDGLNQTFSNFTWNCISQGSHYKAWHSDMKVMGNYTVVSTNANWGSIYFNDLGTAFPLTATIDGNFLQTGGDLRLARAYGDVSLTIKGNFSLSEGSFRIEHTGANGGSSVNLLGNFSMTGENTILNTLHTTLTFQNSFIFAKSGIQQFSRNLGTFGGTQPMSFVVNNGSILDMGTSILDGSSTTFTLSDGAGIVTAHPDGIAASGATGSIQTSGARVFHPNANYTYNGIVAQFTGTGLTSANNLTVNNPSGLTLSGNIVVTNQLNLIAGNFNVGSNTVTLNGPSVNGILGNFKTNSTSNLVFGGSSTSVFVPSGVSQLNNLTINNANGVGLASSVTLSPTGILTLTSSSLLLGDFNLTVTTDPVGPFNNSRMILTNGTGMYIKSGSSVSDFITTYPVGTVGNYSPMVISTLSASTANGTLAVRAVNGKQPKIPFVNDALKKHWVISASGLTGITDVRPNFEYNPSEIAGNSSLYETRVWNGTSFIVPVGATPAGANPFGVNNVGNIVLDGEWTAIDPTVRYTFYSYQSGNWNNPLSWTFDPSGALYNNPSALVPTANDKVVISEGHNIVMPAGLNNQSVSIITIKGTLDLGATTGHTFSIIAGNGRIRISNADVFPASTLNTFFTTDEGTLEYYGSSFSLTSARTVYNLQVNMNTGAILTLLATPYTVSGNLNIQNGTFRMNNNTSTTKLRLYVLKDINVSNGASFTVGTANMLDGSQSGVGSLQYYYVYHSIECYGNIVNNGTIRFTNQAAPNYGALTSAGAVSLFMKGASNNTFMCYGTTDLYNLVVDKGVDKSNILTLYASSQGYFRLYGANRAYNIYTGGEFNQYNPEIKKALWIRTGTLEITGNVFIPSLTEGGSDYYIPFKAGLWLNGDNVIVWSTGTTEPGPSIGGVSGLNVNTNDYSLQSFSIMGDFKISKGTFNSGNFGLVFWPAEGIFGGIFVEGGLLDVCGIRTAVGNPAGNYSFYQSGGLIKFRGDFNNETLESQASLSIKGTDCLYHVSGGIMEFYDGQIGGNIPSDPDGGIFRVESNSTNINVTGGKMKVIRNNPGCNNFSISSTAPINILELSGFSDTELVVPIHSNITILDSLIINDYATLDASTYNSNLTIGGNFVIGNNGSTNNALYIPRSNTTTFNGQQNSTIKIANTSLQSPIEFNNLIIDKTQVSSPSEAYSVLLSSPGRSEISGESLNHLVTVKNHLNVKEGKWNNYRFKTRVEGNLSNTGEIINDVINPGRITLENGSSKHSISGSAFSLSSFGNLELNDLNGAQLLTGISTNDFMLTEGIIDIDIYNLSVTGELIGSSYSTSKMISSRGTEVSKGVSISLSLSGNYTNQDIALIPIGVSGSVSGTGAKYTPLMININGDVGTGPYTGTLNLRAVDKYHPTADPTKLGDHIPFYWISASSDNLNTVTPGIINFTFSESYGFDYSGDKKDTYFRTGIWTEEPDRNLVFTGTGFQNTDYSVGKKDAYLAVQHLYSRQSGNWNNPATWSLTGHHVTNPPVVLNSYDYYQIGGSEGMNHQVTVNGNTSAAGVTILGKSVSGIQAGQSPTLMVNAGTTNNFTKISGGGRFVLNEPTIPVADYSEFLSDNEATFEYSGETYTIPSDFSSYPNLRISGASNSIKTMPAIPVLLRKSLHIYDDVNTGVALHIAGDLTVTDSLNLDNQSKLVFPAGESNHTVTLGNINCVSGGASEINSIEVATGGVYSTPTHKLIVSGDMKLGESTIILWKHNTTNKSVDLILSGNSDSKVYNSSGANMILSRLEINKSNPDLNSVIDKAFSLNAPNNIALKPLIINQGRLRINNVATSLILSGGGGNFVIPASGALIVDKGTMTIRWHGAGLNLDGLLEINGGTVNVYNPAHDNNYIQYTSSGKAAIKITDGLLRVGSHIRRRTTTESGNLIFEQTGGQVDVGYKNAILADRGVFEILNPGSSFTFTGGNFNIHSSHSAATIPAFYINLDPAAVNIGPLSNFNFGGTAGSSTIGIYSTVPLSNVSVLGPGTQTAKISILPMTILGNLSIASGTAFDANGLLLTLKGNFTNAGNFVHKNNTTVFNATANQSITGSTTFYNLTKQESSTLNIYNDIIVSNNLRLEQGILADNGNNIRIVNNVYNVGTHIYGGHSNSPSQLGIHMMGANLQQISGSGIFGKLTIDNSSGVYLPIGNTLFVTRALRLNQGIIDIQGNLLNMGIDCEVEGTGFNPYKMIQTNISFTDNGIKKSFPAGPYNFTFPIGSLGKYTPVTFNITSNVNDYGSITIKASNEIHPSIANDTEPACQLVDQNNVLQYYWVVRSNSMSGFSGTATMQAYTSDIALNNSCGLTSTDYLTARLLVGSELWNKYSKDEFDEANGLLHFDFINTDDNGISGDYMAGLDDAIPNTIATYETITSGNWTDESIWQTVPPGGPVPENGPRGSIVIIKPEHTVNVLNNGDIYVYSGYINGTLNVDTTTIHRLGYVYGTGTIRVVDRSTLPAGDFQGPNGFFTAAGGTIEYAGSSDYSVFPGISDINSVLFSGSGNRDFPNNNITVRGSFTINGPTVRNIFNRDIDIARNFSLGSGKFLARNGGGDPYVTFSGPHQQTISGDFTGTNNSAFYNMRINKSSNGVTLGSPVEVTNYLYLTDGTVHTTLSNILTLTNASNAISPQGGINSYIDGPLKKWIDNGDSFNFPLGNSSRYAQTWVNPSISASPGYWTAQYFNQNPLSGGLNPNNYNSPINFVSNNEYWMVTAPSGPAQAKIQLRWDFQSGLPTEDTNRPNLRIADWNGSAWNELDNGNIISGNESSGTITTNSTTVPSFNTTKYFTLSSVYIPQIFIWTGTNSTAWNLPANWNQSRIPTAVDDVVIPDQSTITFSPLISDTRVCDDLTVQTNGLLTISGGGALTVYGNTLNDGLIVLASPMNTGMSGSFIDNGTISGTGSFHFQRYLNRNNYHYISSPILGGNAHSGYFTSIGSSFNANFYRYNEAVDLDNNPATAPIGPHNANNLMNGWTFVQRRITDDIVYMNRAQGYAFYTDFNGIITYMGENSTVNTGTISKSDLSFTHNDPLPGPLPTYYDGWHLLGNPYPSSINWNLVSAGLTNIDNAIYVWDGSQYASYVNGISGGKGTQTNVIAPMQGFFVHANAQNAGYTFNNTHRLHSPATTFKSKAIRDEHQNLLSLKLIANGKSDAMVLYFNADASNEFDSKYDAFKLFSWNNDPNNSYNKDVPHIFTSTQGKSSTDLSINGLAGMPQAQIAIPVGIRLGTSGEYTIKKDQFTFGDWHVYLVDKQEDKSIYLNDNDLYVFNYAAGESRSRFELRFVRNNSPMVNQTISKKYTDEKSLFDYVVDNGAFVENDENDAIVSYQVSLPDGSALPAWLSFNPQTKTFAGIPANNDVGPVSILIKAFDKFGAFASQTFELEVINVNDPPVLSGTVPDFEVVQDEYFSYVVQGALFTDIDKGDKLSFSVRQKNGAPVPAWLTFNTGDYKLHGTPGNADVGQFELEIVATDLAGAAAITQFIIKVSDKNDKPYLNRKIEDYEVFEKAKVSFKLSDETFIDIDKGDELTLSVKLASGEQLPKWLLFNANEAEFSGTPLNDDVGELSVVIRATDKSGASATDIFKVIVLNVNDVPVLNGKIPDQEIDANSDYFYKLPDNLFVDYDKGDELSVFARLTNGDKLPSWLVFDSNALVFNGKPEKNEELDIEVVAIDLEGATVSDTYHLKIKSTTGIDIFSRNDIAVYPNPANDQFYVKISQVYFGANLTISDNSGKRIMYQKLTQEITQIDISKYPSGMYFIHIEFGNSLIPVKLIRL
jgi:hypothetical protein